MGEINLVSDENFEFDGTRLKKYKGRSAEVVVPDGAQFELGKLYLYGQGVVQSREEAVKWLRKAADQGNLDAKKLMDEQGLK